jgi:DNA-directed RNA polymerase delta subunit
VSDEFFRLSQPEAARRYLKKIGHAMALDDILDALTKGGCAVGGSDPKKVLYISVVRDTRNFVKLPNGMIGLREFYPDRKLKSEKKEKTVKKRARKKNKSQAAKKEAKAETDVAA